MRGLLGLRGGFFGGVFVGRLTGAGLRVSGVFTAGFGRFFVLALTGLLVGTLPGFLGGTAPGVLTRPRGFLFGALGLGRDFAPARGDDFDVFRWDDDGSAFPVAGRLRGGWGFALVRFRRLDAIGALLVFRDYQCQGGALVARELVKIPLNPP